MNFRPKPYKSNNSYKLKQRSFLLLAEGRLSAHSHTASGTYASQISWHIEAKHMQVANRLSYKNNLLLNPDNEYYCASQPDFKYGFDCYENSDMDAKSQT